MKDNTNKEELILKYIKKQKRDRIQKIILLIIIIILLLLWILSFRLGKIGYQEASNVSTDSIKLIKVFDSDIEMTKDTQLNIFENEKFNGQKIIAPNSKGTYTFCIKNITDTDVIYNILFNDKMKHPINMKYRLKKDNNYIVGNEARYVEIKDLNINDIIITKDSINVFTLEWYWEDNDKKDTIVGSQKSDQYYTLNLGIYSKEYIK